MKTPNTTLIPIVCQIFQELAVGASLVRGAEWFEIQRLLPNITDFELQHGVLTDRHAYNARCIALARRRKTDVVGEHVGLCDLFAPVCIRGVTDCVLVIGPFARSRPSGAEIAQRWRALTGHQGHPADPEFAHYLEVTLSVLVLEKPRLTAFRRLVGCLTLLMTSEGRPKGMLREVTTLRDELAATRFCERLWNAVREMVDEKASRLWSSPYREDQLAQLGLPRLPGQVVVGLCASRKTEPDPVDDLVRRNAFQRACVDLGLSAGRIAAGSIGDHGVTFLAAGDRSAERGRRRLLRFAEEAASVARRSFGLALHLGEGDPSAPLPRQFQTALAAAEIALSKGVPLVRMEHFPTDDPLGRLRRELAALVEENPRALPARFDHFVEAVARRCGYQREPVRAHLEAGFERMVESLEKSDVLEPRALRSLCSDIERAAAEANTVSDLFAVYRRATREIAEAVLRPAQARHDRSLLRVEEYLSQHYAERLALRDVARVAGFAPSYFSQLFHQHKRMTLTGYLTQLRVTRAKELLANTSLGLDRVAEIAGLARRQYLTRVFRKKTGETPSAYRRRVHKRAKFRSAERNKVFVES